ncbi:hypothetical protein PP914_gp222 [Arthrobacter phage Qui]|uniref:Uncharacterized protein n=1 Tax=Arthrobacter phage Qui TaxID=2603260 RepID=A0A5B8WFU8_9CAUD|nr:hypothetical protein PP914_gp222 [Arthrobacter phage Qui]QED11710.1 hypothetical protein SEA_QUI_222 [Arthrobacter phage Qui]QOC56541.1 hypothetical protein SEA_PAELLA_222 [Arthrobacter phage Paella]
MRAIFKICKFCGHDKGEHRGYSKVGLETIRGLCVTGHKWYGDEGIYGHCGCWTFTPKWKFWVRKNI